MTGTGSRVTMFYCTSCCCLQSEENTKPTHTHASFDVDAHDVNFHGKRPKNEPFDAVMESLGPISIEKPNESQRAWEVDPSDGTKP
mgnify:CR=1 FL=1